METDTFPSTFKTPTHGNGAVDAEPVRHSEGVVAALAAMGVAMAMQASGRKHGSLFVGQWVAPFLLFGVYNKLVKVSGSDRLSR